MKRKNKENEENNDSQEKKILKECKEIMRHLITIDDVMSMSE